MARNGDIAIESARITMTLRKEGLYVARNAFKEQIRRDLRYLRALEEIDMLDRGILEREYWKEIKRNK